MCRNVAFKYYTSFSTQQRVFMKLLRNKCKPQVAMGAVEINDRVTIRSAALHLKRVGCNVRSAPVTTVRVGVVESKYTLNNHSSLFASSFSKRGIPAQVSVCS